jgi:hypothetical protein
MLRQTTPRTKTLEDLVVRGFRFALLWAPSPEWAAAKPSPFAAPNTNGAPFIFKEAEAPSRTLIISNPSRPLVIG